MEVKMDTSNSHVIETRKVKNIMHSTIDHKRIFIFVGITFGIVITAALVIYFNGGTKSDFTPVAPLAIIFTNLIAYAPALGNIATRLITREGWSNTYLRPNLRRGWPYYLAAFTLPLLAIILGGAIYYLLFPGQFDPSMAFAREAGKITATDNLGSVMGRKALEGFVIVLSGALLLFIGEEFGWRAYLLPKLMPLGPRKAALLTGVIWGIYHWPMIFMGFGYGQDYWGAPVAGALLFVLIILSPGIIYSWMTLRSGSVWPACIAHAENNAFYSLMILFLIRKPDVLIGPSNNGIVGCLGYVLLALPIFLIPGALIPAVMAVTKNQERSRKPLPRQNLVSQYERSEKK
jgi:membrane protease YdiL (CAAX protease family)